MVFYKEGDSSISATDITSYSPSSNNRLITGSDKANSVQGLNGAHATNANYVGFIWNIGSGDYEVSKVSYIRYTLNLKQYDNDASDNYNYHFYTSQLTPVVLFENGVCKNGASLLGDGRAFVSFGGTYIYQEGLYKVTREYKNELPDGTNDVQILYYYFIVDRNGIIDLSNGIGEHIMIQLLESETDFNNFKFH